MARSGVPASGRALRFVLWRAPMGAAKYAMARNMALATEEGRRWLTLAGALFWVWVIWTVASYTGVRGFQEVAAFLWLVWFWRFFVNVRRVWVNRRNLKAQARNLQLQREMYQILTQLPGQMQQWAASLPRPGGEGGIDVLNLFRTPPHPAEVQEQRTRRQQADQTREWLPEDGKDVHLGDRFEPVIPMPRWLRRRQPR